MSYLIALYVYYHGNNLAVFGITPGLKEEGMLNQGLVQPEEIDPELVNPELIQAAINERKKEEEGKRINDWNEIMREAIYRSQQDSYKMFRNGNVNNTVFDTTPEAIVDDYDEDGSIPLDFFTSINNM